MYPHPAQQLNKKVISIKRNNQSKSLKWYNTCLAIRKPLVCHQYNKNKKEGRKE
jgi:hypothetical protein